MHRYQYVQQDPRPRVSKYPGAKRATQEKEVRRERQYRGFFWADRGDGEHGTHIWFRLLSESRIEVKVWGEVAIYTVKLDDMGCCKLWSEDQSLDPWQVLKLALEPLLFGSPGPGSSG